MGQREKPQASLSMDLDNQWSYLKIHGDPEWTKLPSYLDKLVPPLLDLLEGLKLKITFFVVGQDAALDKNRGALQEIARRGHEIGNHSFHHEPWFDGYSRDQIEREVLSAEDAISRVTSQKPEGFRGPGFSWSQTLFEVLADHGYVYDASTLPMFLGPLARMYYFWKSRLSSAEKKQRKELYGNFRDGLRPVKPYRWGLPSGRQLLEIPVSTVPILKLPFHLSYLLYIRTYSKVAMQLYLRLALSLCALTQTRPSFLLHPLDLIGKDQAPELSFFPGMNLTFEEKRDVFLQVMALLARHFTFTEMSSFAKAELGRENIRVIWPE
jgi:hypothetical protein